MEKIRSPWLRGSIHLLSLDCDGADDEEARQFGFPDGNARRFHGAFDCQNADAPRTDARFDGTDANTPRSNNEFRPGPSTL
jgi:hypothetical protein